MTLSDPLAVGRDLRSLPPPRGSCFGFEIRSELEFSLLREGSGVPLSVVHADETWEPSGEPLLEWLPRSDRPLHAKIFADGSRYRMWTDLEGWFAIDPSALRVTAPPCEDTIRLEERILGFPLLLSFLPRGDLPLHAAAVEIGGSALLLAAPGYHGKTTLAAAFLGAGFRILTEDIACCRVSEAPTLAPGPAMLRVRTPSYERLEFPGTRVVAREPGRVHLALEGSARGDGSPVPLRGIVFLRLDEGEGTIERVTSATALPDVWALSFKLPSDAARARCFSSAAELVDRVPVWNLRRPLRYDTLPALVDLIHRTCAT
ncbi:MAG TPA: hypothetical protein VGL16_01900 [Actinomycetota bacterium]|jgi:hypothetical protein